VVQARRRRAWSRASSSRWTPGNPALCQCSATALVVQGAFGGEILKTRVPFEGGEAWHFYNRIGGRCFDVTAEQFAAPVTDEDLPASEAEALRDTSEPQVAEPAAAFRAAAAG
jgi:hypothetical protein